MMFHAAQGQGLSKNQCSLLAVVCGKVSVSDKKQKLKQVVSVSDNKPRYPFPDLAYSGRLQVQVLSNPSTDEFRRVVESTEPNFVYLQGQQQPGAFSEEIGSLVWGDVDLSTPEALCRLFGSTLPTIVYLEIPNGQKLAEALHSKGVPYIIYWKNAFSCYAACHFRHSLLSVVQSSCSHTWDAFQLALASFRLYCVRNSNVLPSNSQKTNGKPGPCLLGDPPMIDVAPAEVDGQEEESSSGTLSAIKIYDDDVTMRFLVCGVPCTLDACLLGSLEDGLNALLSIEIRGSKLHNRASAPPPPLQAGTFSRGVVTMRCDLSTCSSAHISLLVSGSAQTCFNDQILENHIKNELIEKSQLVHALPSSEETKLPLSEPRKSTSIACGASVFEVCMKVPTWASQGTSWPAHYHVLWDEDNFTPDGIQSLQKSESNKSYKHDLPKAVEKLGKVHKEADIRSYIFLGAVTDKWGRHGYLLVHTCNVNLQGRQSVKIEKIQKSFEDSEMKESLEDPHADLDEEGSPDILLGSQSVQNECGAKVDENENESLVDQGIETADVKENNVNCEGDRQQRL